MSPLASILCLPLALGFAAPALAITGLALASVPIVIHFLNRRRYKTQKWAAMQYLLEAMRRNRRRLQFENLLLLALRCCAVLLVGFALARPLGCSDAAAGRLVGQTTRLHVIVIDNSASMAYQLEQADGRTCLERAKRLAGDLVKQLGQTHDAVCVIPAASGQPAPLTPDYDLEAAIQDIARLDQTYLLSDLPAALRHALTIAGDSGEFTSRRLYIFTDATRHAWEDARIAHSLKEIGPQLASRYEIAAIDVGDKQAANASVASIRMLGSVAMTSMPADFAAKASANAPISESLIWQSGSRVLGTTGAITLGPDSSEQLLPQIGLDSEGPTAISARLEPGDRLPEDDQRALVIGVRKQLNVLVAEGGRGTQALQSPGTFIQLALSPGQAGGESEAAKVEVISESELSGRPLAGLDAVALAPPSAMSASDAQQLRHFVDDGGTLIVFMGEGVSAEQVNQVLLPAGLLPGRISAITSLAEGQEPFRLDFRPDAALHPLLRVFRGEQNSGLATTRVFTYARVDLDAKLNPQRVLDFVGGDPAITVHTLGRGKVIFFATSADTRWTTLPAKPAFVALIHEILLGTVNADIVWANVPAGSRLEIPRRVLDNATPVLSSPTGQVVPLEPADTTTPQIAFRSEPLVKPGLYRLQVDGRSLPVAASFPSEESDLTHMAAADIRKSLGDIKLQIDENRLPASLTSEGDKNDFGWPLLLGALGVLLAESFLAMWFRR